MNNNIQKVSDIHKIKHAELKFLILYSLSLKCEQLPSFLTDQARNWQMSSYLSPRYENVYVCILVIHTNTLLSNIINGKIYSW
jgi:hypothetical protein